MALKKQTIQDIPRAFISCGHNGCQYSAMARLRLKTGWLNVCRMHYDLHAQLEADEFCRVNGLDTLAKKMAYCKSKMKSFGHLIVDRVPGQDDEERAA